MLGSFRGFLSTNLLGNEGNIVFSVIYIPSNLAVFLIYLLTWSCNVCYEGELLYFVLSSDIHQSFHDDYEKAFIYGQEHEYVNSGFMSRVYKVVRDCASQITLNLFPHLWNGDRIMPYKDEKSYV